jgi:hypothetical protein
MVPETKTGSSNWTLWCSSLHLTSWFQNRSASTNGLDSRREHLFSVDPHEIQASISGRMCKSLIKTMRYFFLEEHFSVDS